jgi:hypothetical protein
VTTLRVYTARVTYAGPDRLDVTKSAGPDGLPFAPSGRILWPLIAARKLHGAAAVEAAWPSYVEKYTAEMRASYREQRLAWDALLARAEVTLVCYCTDPAHCHRKLLAEILGKLGATYEGERPIAAPTRRGPKSPPRRAEDTLADLQWLGGAILERVRRRERPHFRAFVVSAGGALEGWPRPTATQPQASIE